jgi:small conductance mechanosensitive channel
MNESFDRIWTELSDQGRNAASEIGDFSVRLIWAVIILMISVFLVRRIRNRVRSGLERRNVKNNVPELVANIFTFGAYILAGTIILRSLGANSTSLVTSIGLVTAAISLSLQDVLKNFVAGLYLLAEQPFRPGDRIRVVGEEGVVERVDIRTTQLRNVRAEHVLVPNSKLFTEVVGNRSTYRLHEVVVRITGAPSPPRQAAGALLEAITDLPGLSNIPPRIEVTKAAPELVDLRATLFFTADLGPSHETVTTIHELFPKATVEISTS